MNDRGTEDRDEQGFTAAERADRLRTSKLIAASQDGHAIVTCKYDDRPHPLNDDDRPCRDPEPYGSERALTDAERASATWSLGADSDVQ